MEWSKITVLFFFKLFLFIAPFYAKPVLRAENFRMVDIEIGKFEFVAKTKLFFNSDKVFFFLFLVDIFFNIIFAYVQICLPGFFFC